MFPIDKQIFEGYSLDLPKDVSESILGAFKYNKFFDYTGKVFVDDIDRPNIFIIDNGFIVEAYGDSSVNSYDEDLVSHIKDKNQYFHLYLSQPELEQKFEHLIKDYIVNRTNRLTYRLNKELFKQHANWRDKIPHGFTLVEFDGTCTEFLQKYGKTEDWWNPESNRYGRLILDDAIDKVVSECFSVQIMDGVVEVGIYTDEAYWKRGFAYLTAAAFIEYSLQRGLEPNWGCYTRDHGSIALAKKLGFELVSDRRTLEISFDK